jgi:hypothetical protein
MRVNPSKMKTNISDGLVSAASSRFSSGQQPTQSFPGTAVVTLRVRVSEECCANQSKMRTNVFDCLASAACSLFPGNGQSTQASFDTAMRSATLRKTLSTHNSVDNQICVLRNRRCLLDRMTVRPAPDTGLLVSNQGWHVNLLAASCAANW